jgi:chromosome segregation and condensation protein ScpB
LLALERSDASPRRAHYRTTQRFLDLFGLSSLDDLPHSQELDRK